MTTESLSCKIIKMVSGENIICFTDDTCNDLGNERTIILLEPTVISTFRIPRSYGIAESFILQPWFPLSEETIVEIQARNIVAVANAKPSFRETYEKYLEQMNSEEEQSIQSEEKSSDEIENTVNELMQSMFNEGEEDNEHDGSRTFGKRTLH